MPYQVSRGDHTYGPYSLEELQRYVSSGNVLLSDMAKSEEMAEWRPVSQVLAEHVPGYGQIPAPPAPGYIPAPVPVPAGGWPSPPDLNWGLLLLLDIFTCGLFGTAWSIVQAAWFKKIRPGTKVLVYYCITAFLSLVNTGHSAQSVSDNMHHHIHTHPDFGGGLVSLLYLVLILVARFTFRAELEEHYNTAEPVGLRLSGVMTFFFGNLYFQYHFNRINEMKRTLFPRP